MSFGTFTLTGHLDMLDGIPAVGAVKVVGVPEVILDTAGDVIYVSPKTVALDKLGDFAVDLPTNSATGDSTSVGYRISSEMRHGTANITPVEFYAKAIGETVDLADIVPAGELDPLYPATQAALDAATARDDAQLAQAAAETALAAVQAVGATNDTIVAALVDDADSDTRSALEVLIAALAGTGGGGSPGSIDAAAVISGILASARIPDLDAAKIISGVLGVARIPNLDATKIVSGVLSTARIPNLSSTYAPASVVAGLVDQQNQLMEVAASTEELSLPIYSHGRWSGSPAVMVQTLGSAAGQIIQSPWVAPWACSILSMDVVVEAGAITTSDTNYVTLELRKSHDGTISTIASKTTKTTGSGGEAIDVRIPWSFDGATWNATARLFAKGDLLQMRWVATGSATLTFPVAYTVRVQPL